MLVLTYPHVLGVPGVNDPIRISPTSFASKNTVLGLLWMLFAWFFV